MKITLDRLALKALIDEDPSFELDLKAAVLAEVGRRFFEKDAKRVIEAAEPALFKQALAALQEDADLRGKIAQVLSAGLVEREPGYYGKMRLTGEAKTTLDQAVAAIKQRMMTDATNSIETATRDLIAQKVKAAMEDSNIEERIDRRVNALVDKEIEERATAKFRLLKAKIETALS
jgi:hypothetical protein